MKRRVMLVFLCITFAFGGCGKSDAKETVANTYQEWREMEQELWSPGLPEITDETYLFEESDYYKTSDEKVQSIEDMKSAVEEICTATFAENEYYKPLLKRESPMYLEKDGVLYKLQADLVLNYGSKITDINIIKQEKECIHARLEVHDEYREETQIMEIKIVLEDGKWLIDDLKIVDET